MRIGLIAGEASGDILGAGLITSLKERVGDVQFEGVAGPAMEAAGCLVLEPSETLAVFGLIDPLLHLPKLLRLRRSLIDRWTENPPDVVIGIDAPDFNLGLETKLRARGVRTIHYVSPSVWAWRQGRVRKVARAVDKVLCLLPFEKTFYDQHDVEAEFVGHPMADNIPTDLDAGTIRKEMGITATRVVAVLPGSRKSEVTRLGPVFARACADLADMYDDLHFVAPMASATLTPVFESHLAAVGLAERFALLDGNAQSAMAASDVVLLASGTATLQAALLGKPQVAAYRFGWLTYAIAWTFNLVNVPFFSLPNLLTEKPLVPEFLQSEATPEALTREVRSLLEDDERRFSISRQFSALRKELARGADDRAANAVLELAARS